MIGRKSYIDELVFDSIFKLPPLTFSLITGLLGIAIFSYTIFVLIPKKLRITVLLSVFLGGISGSILWLFVLGPITLP